MEVLTLLLCIGRPQGPLFSVDSIIVYRSTPGSPIQAHQGVRPTFLQPGDLVRVALRIQGLSFHTHPTFGTWSGRFRLQHKIMALFIKAA